MKVFLNEYIDPAGLRMLQERAEITDDFDQLGEVDAIISRGLPVTRDMMERAPKLKVIGKHGVGYNQIDIEAAKELGIRVIYTPGQNTLSVAELAVTLMLSASRMVGSAYRQILDNKCQRVASMDFCGCELTGKTVGLIGLGSVGRHTAKIVGGGFSANVIGFDAYASDECFAQTGVARCSTLQDLLKQADYISVSVPLTDETRNLIDEEGLRLCKSTAIIVNTSRGGIINEQALYKALKEGWIRGAGSDVFVSEPPLEKDIPLFDLPNFIGTSHIGGTSSEALQRCAVTVVEEIFRVLDKREPLYPVV